MTLNIITTPLVELVSDQYPRAPILRRLRTWVVVVNTNIARIFDEKRNHFALIDSITHHQQTGMMVHCRASYKEKNLISYNPGIYTHGRHSEPLHFAHKIAAYFDESLWNDRFDQLGFLLEPKITGDILISLSIPVRARVAACVQNNAALLDHRVLQRDLPQIISRAIYSSKEKNCEEK